MGILDDLESLRQLGQMVTMGNPAVNSPGRPVGVLASASSDLAKGVVSPIAGAASNAATMAPDAYVGSQFTKPTGPVSDSDPIHGNPTLPGRGFDFASTVAGLHAPTAEGDTLGSAGGRFSQYQTSDPSVRYSGRALSKLGEQIENYRIDSTTGRYSPEQREVYRDISDHLYALRSLNSPNTVEEMPRYPGHRPDVSEAVNDVMDRVLSQHSADFQSGNLAQVNRPITPAPVRPPSTPPRADPFRVPPPTFTPRDDIAAAFPGKRFSEDAHTRLTDIIDRSGHTPSEFLDKMFGPDRNTVDTYPRGKNMVIESYPKDPATGNSMGLISREFRPDTNSVHHDFFELKPEYQGQNFGKRMLAGQTDLYRKMGLDYIDTFANISVGGYAWSKYGYVPENEWQFKALADRSILPRLEEVKGQISPEDYSDIQKLVASRDPKAIFGIADHPAKVFSNYVDDPKVPKLEPEVVLDPESNKYMVHDGEGKILSGPHDTYKDGTSAALNWVLDNPKNTSTTLGKHLLMGTSWDGKLDLKDPMITDRLDAYLGKSR